jgi:hypothetical protein
MQQAVQALKSLGSLPSSINPDISLIEAIEARLKSVLTPISDEDARVLVSLFGTDDCFGLAWTLLHLIETAPSWPIADALTNIENEWIARLKERSSRL